MTWVIWTLVPMARTPRGRGGATFVKVLAQSECGRFRHFGICGPNPAWRSLRAKGMGVFVGLTVDRVWNGGSNLLAGVEIYYWEHPQNFGSF